MIQRFSTNFAVLSIFFDLAITFGSLFIARYLRPMFGEGGLFQSIWKVPYLPVIIYVIFPIVWLVYLFLFNLYDGRKNFRVVDEFSNLTMASVLATGSMAGILYLTYRDISRGLFLSYILIAFVLLILWRLAARILYPRRLAEKGYKDRILIIGAGPIGTELKNKLETFHGHAYNFIGYLDDARKEDIPEVLGTIDQIHEIVKEKRVNHVIIALPRSAFQRVDFVIHELEKLPVRISVIPDYFHLTVHQAAVSEFAGIPILELRAPTLSEYQRITKRIFDLVVVGFIMIFAFPVMAVIALLILIFDGRPIFYFQNRVGENGKIIKIYKFRTMVKDADKLLEQVATKNENGEIVYKSKTDPRVTKLGKFLRRFSLDEFPQFLNVLRGTLSLVGPRPELPTLVEKYEPWQRARFTVPQGLTGWWQIHGRSDKPMHLHTEEDLYYVSNYSIWLDISITIKTIWIILRGKGAY